MSRSRSNPGKDWKKDLMVVGVIICRRDMEIQVWGFLERSALIIKVYPHKDLPILKDLNFGLKAPNCYKQKCHMPSALPASNHSCCTF